MKIQELRKKIDRLDSQLLKLLNQRAKLSSAIGQWKLASGSHVYAPDREEHLLRTLESKNDGPLSAVALRSIYREILSTSRACQTPLKVACVGHEFSDAWKASRRRFGSSDHYRPVAGLPQLLSQLTRHKIDVGVVDREDLIDLLWEKKLRAPKWAVCGDIILQFRNSPKQPVSRDVYFLLSRQAVPANQYSKTVVVMETVALDSVKEWQAAFSVLKRHLLHVERIKTGTGRKSNRWLVELKGHWESDDLGKLMASVKGPDKKMIRRWILIGSYPEVPHYA